MKSLWYYGIWFIPSATNDRDFLGQLVKANGRWEFRYRFRYYSEESVDPHDSKDRKSGYVASAKDDTPESLEKMLVSTETVLTCVEREFGCERDFVKLECSNDAPKFMFELGSREWAHLKQIPVEDAR